MEKIDLLIWDDTAAAAAKPSTYRGSAPARCRPRPTCRGRPCCSARARLCGATRRSGSTRSTSGPTSVEQVPGDAYLVTESVPQAVQPGELLTHFSWFPKPDRLSEEEFFHGWHTIHTPSSARLHPLRQGYVRDAVARTLTPGSPPVRAIVSEFFAEDDYLDPARLFAPDELTTTIEELPLVRRPGGRVELPAPAPRLEAQPVGWHACRPTCSPTVGIASCERRRVTSRAPTTTRSRPSRSPPRQTSIAGGSTTSSARSGTSTSPCFSGPSARPRSLR